MQPNFLFCWPTARTAIATPDQLLTAITEEVNNIQCDFNACFQYQYLQHGSILFAKIMSSLRYVVPETAEWPLTVQTSALVYFSMLVYLYRVVTMVTGKSYWSSCHLMREFILVLILLTMGSSSQVKQDRYTTCMTHIQCAVVNLLGISTITLRSCPSAWISVHFTPNQWTVSHQERHLVY